MMNTGAQGMSESLSSKCDSHARDSGLAQTDVAQTDEATTRSPTTFSYALAQGWPNVGHTFFLVPF